MKTFLKQSTKCLIIIKFLNLAFCVFIFLACAPRGSEDCTYSNIYEGDNEIKEVFERNCYISHPNKPKEPITLFGECLLGLCPIQNKAIIQKCFEWKAYIIKHTKSTCL